MLFLNKLLPIFVLPLGLAALLLGYALWKKRRWPVVAALVLVYGCSTPWVGGQLIRWIESAHPAIAIHELEPADAVVVLGGIYGPAMPDGYVTNWSDSVERYEAGVRLMQAEKAGVLVFMGAKLPWEKRVTTEGAELRSEAIARGISPERIVVTTTVANTADEAREIAALMRARGWKRVVVVTTTWHMRRAAHRFNKAGVVFTPFPVDFRTDREGRTTLLDFLPKADGLAMTETALRETYGYWFYRMFR